MSHRPYWLTRPVALWLEKQLDFPNWTAADIGAMPLKRIGDWAQANNIAMDKLYATEQREGGTPALDVGVPGFAREDLSVFTETEWRAQTNQGEFKAEYIINVAWPDRFGAAG